MEDIVSSAHHKRLAKAFADYKISPPDDSNPIFKLLRNAYYLEQVLNGESGCFMPVAFPTGVGKTFNTLSLMLHAIIEDIQNEVTQADNYVPRYFYYITNSVDNVYDAYKSLTKSVDESSSLNKEQKKAILERILYTPANSKVLLDLMAKRPQDMDKIKKLFSIGDPSSLAKNISQIGHEQTILASINIPPSDKKALSERLQKMASECYTAIIHHIQKIQWGNNPVPLSDQNIDLLKELIPGVALESGRSRAIFMTTKKLLFGVQQTKGKFHPVRNLSGNMLIIDEVDRQHQEILTHLISANDTDLLATIRTIHSNLKEHDLCTKPQYKGVAKLFLDYLQEVSGFFEECSLRNSFDIHHSASYGEKQILLFSDKLTTHNTSVSGQLKVSFNDHHQQHEIALKGQFPERQEHDFPKFLGRLERLANREFQSIVRQAEELYRDNLSSIIPAQELMQLTSTQAVASILDQLNLHTLRDQLNRQLNYLVGRQYSPRKSAANYHTRGIRMIEVDRLPEAQDSVMFKHHGFNVTPSGMLASWVESGCKILGVSATAECESVIHNFDILYLKESLGARYIELTVFQKKAIHEYYEKERNYKDASVKIIINPIDQDYAFIRDLLKRWQPQSKNIDLLCKQLFNCDDRNVDFGLSWLSKLCGAMDAFAKSKANRYMVGMLNRSIRAQVALFLQWYSDRLSEREDTVIKIVPAIDANFLKQGKFDSEVISFLESLPGKIIALTTYQTMSSGKNPDYKINLDLENNTLRHVGHRSSDRTDIDFIYLEEPTNLISIDGNPETKTSDRLLLLSYGMALQESGVITPFQANSWTRDVVTHESPFNLCRDIKNKYYQKDSDDCLHAIYRIIEQAVGRTARTEMKRETIHIASDAALLMLLANDDREALLFSHEYRELVDYSKREFSWANPPTDREGRRRQNLAVLHTARSLGAIERMLIHLNKMPSVSDIESWKELRSLALQSPALTLPPLNREYYVLSPTEGQYEYTPPADEWKTDEYRFFEFSTKPIKRVSEAASMLSTLIKNPVIRAHFELNGFCTHWPENAKYILTPPMFINIYLGALGEEAGKSLLAEHGFEFEALPPDQFEQFDDIIILQHKKALIDFKHWDLAAWRSLPVEERKTGMEKISQKLKGLSTNKLIICNLLTKGSEPILFFDTDFRQVEDEKQASIISIPNLLNELDSSVNIDAVLTLARWLLA